MPIAMQADCSALSSVRVFQGLPAALVARASERCAWREIDAGVLIMSHDDRSREVHFLVAGRVRVTIYSVGGRRVGAGDLCAGEMFGELHAIDGRARVVSVIAEEACTVATLSGDDFIALIRSEPDFAMRVLQQTARNVRALTARIIELSTLSVSGRLHAELLRLADRDGEASVVGVRLRRTPTHADLAARISTHREAVTRELSRLLKLGLLTKEDRALVIKDVAGMRALLKPQTQP